MLNVALLKQKVALMQIQKQKALQMQKQKALQMQKQKALQMQKQKALQKQKAALKQKATLIEKPITNLDEIHYSKTSVYVPVKLPASVSIKNDFKPIIFSVPSDYVPAV